MIRAFIRPFMIQFTLILMILHLDVLNNDLQIHLSNKIPNITVKANIIKTDNLSLSLASPCLSISKNSTINATLSMPKIRIIFESLFSSLWTITDLSSFSQCDSPNKSIVIQLVFLFLFSLKWKVTWLLAY